MADDRSFFNASYSGTPPWDIGRPQPAFVELAEAGQIRGSVLDVGCGTGENAMYLAGLGHEVVGLDAAPAAIAKARAKAAERGSTAGFIVGDALALDRLGRRFDTVIDCGLFHTFADEERSRFARSLHDVLEPGGTYFLQCFSERQPGTFGPRRVTQAEIRETFADGWEVEEIREASFEINFRPGEAQGWLATIRRT